MVTRPTKLFIPSGASVALGFIVLCLVVYILKVASAILIPFVIAIFVWYLINGMARAICRVSFLRKRISRRTSFTLAILVLSSVAWVGVDFVARNVGLVAEAAPAYQKHLQEFIPSLKPAMRELIAYVDIGAVMTEIVKILSGIAGQTVVVMFYTAFFLYEQRFFNHKLSGMIPNPETEMQVRDVLCNIDVKVQRYISVKTLVSVMAGVLTWLILKVWHVDFSAFLGIIAFLLNFIPYIGPAVATIVPSVIALAQLTDVPTAVTILSMLVVMHGIVGHGIEPYLMGEKLNLSPIFIISSLAMWGMIWGVSGMFLSVPITVIAMIVLSQFPRTKPIAILLSRTGVVDGDVCVKKGICLN